MTQTDQDLRIDYIEIPVLDVPRARTFYQALFGWKFTDYGPDYTSFEDGRMNGGLRLEPSLPGNGVLLVVYALDLEAMVPKVAEAGGTIVQPTFDFPGGRRFHFADPEGNELAMWTDQPAST